MAEIPDLSRFELQCLRRLWTRREATVREIHGDLPDPPGYSTVRKIFERLEEKGAVERAGMLGNACVYRSQLPATAVIRREIRRFLTTVFDGSAAPLVAHLAEMDEMTLDDLRELEQRLRAESTGNAEEKAPPGNARSGRPRRGKR